MGIAINVAGFRGARNFSGTIGKNLLVAGPNGTGKTSVCQAIAAAACGDGSLGFAGITKGTAQQLVHDGFTIAEASVVIDNQASAHMRWPSMERSSMGAWKDLSAIAVGLLPLPDLSPKELGAALVEPLRIAPEQADLQAALPDTPPDTLMEVWREITLSGWDAAHRRATESGSKLKGRWEQITKERFGAKKALSWMPPGWRADLEQITVEQATQGYNEAQAKHIKAMVGKGVTAERRKELQELAAEFPAREQTAKNALASAHNFQARANEARASLALVPNPDNPPPSRACPACGCLLHVTAAGLFQAKAPQDLAQIDAARIAYGKARKVVTEAEQRHSEAVKTADAAAAACKEARQAVDDVAVMPPPSDASEEEARDAEFEAAKTLQMVTAKRDAAQVMQQIGVNAEIVAALADTGVRQAVLTRKIASLNDSLKWAAQQSGWREAAVTSDMTVTFAGRAYQLLSVGEKARVRIMMQVVIALAEKAPFVIIDGAEALDADGRNGMIGLLTAAILPALIGMTISRRHEMPDLAAAGLGVSVWMQDGAVAPQQAAA